MRVGHTKRLIRLPGARMAAIYSLVINLLIYLLLVVMYFYGRNAVIPSDDQQHPPFTFGHKMFWSGMISSYFFIFLLLCINFYVLRSARHSNRGNTVVSIFVSLLFIVVWNRLQLIIQTGLLNMPPPPERAVFGSLMRDIMLGAMTVFLAHIVFLNYRRQMVALENEALKAEYERARYEALKNQIDPHFLFNTLNTLNSVITVDPPKAQEYVQKLSSIFRYTIQNRDVTTLTEELGFTRDYCTLMQIRFGENLGFEFDISGKYDNYLIVPFSIQTLVENAIKHNVISNRQPLTVSIRTTTDDTVIVSNSINPKKEADPGEGIGLANLSERYRLKWEKEITIRNDGQTFSVEIPLVANNNGTNIIENENGHS